MQLLIDSAKAYFFAIFYNVWRALRGRPHFAHIADTQVNFLTFLYFFAFTSLLVSASSLDNEPVATVVFIGLTRWASACFLFMSLLDRKERSRVLLSSMFAATAGIDILEAVLRMCAPSDEVVAVSYVVTHVIHGLILVKIYNYFHTMPPSIKLRGFSPRVEHLKKGPTHD